MKSLILSLCVGCCFAVAKEPVNSTLSPLLQSAKNLLEQDTVREEYAVILAGELVSKADLAVDDSLYAEALYSAQRLYDRADRCEEGVDICRRLVQNAPASVFREQSFEDLWMYFSDDGLYPLKGAEFAIDMAIASQASLSTHYFRLGFNTYLAEGMWTQASEAGMRYLRAVESVHDASIILDIAEPMLKAGESERTIELLEKLIREFPRDPAAVRGCTELGLIYSALGRVEEAQDQFARAWSTYQKYRRRDSFSHPEIIHSAARSLWESTEYNFAELKQNFADRISLKDKAVRRDRKRILAGYELVMRTDESYAASCWTRIGDLHRATAEALLIEGYESIRVDQANSQINPFDAALPEYREARISYEKVIRATPRAIHPIQHWSDLNVDWQRRAIQNRYNVLARQADIVFTWADEIWKHAPQRKLGNKGLAPRFTLLVERVIPLVDQSLIYRKLSLDAASSHPAVIKIESIWERVNQETWTSMTRVLDLCARQWNMTASTAQQLSKTLQITANPAAVKSLRETLVGQLNVADFYWRDGQKAITDLYSSYLQCRPEADQQQRWEAAVMVFHRDYADMARLSSRQIEESTVNLDPLDPIALTLKQRLRKTAAEAARAEKQALMAALETAERLHFRNEAYLNIYNRLRALEPTRYPNFKVYRASRK